MAVEHYKKFQRFVRENPSYLEDRSRPVSAHKTGRPIGYQTAYTVRSNDAREIVKIKNLQLLCFKLATHKPKINRLLQQYSKGVKK